MNGRKSIDDEETVSRFYPTWRETISCFDVDTICVPPCLDVQSTYSREFVDESSPHIARVKGQNAEILFMNKIQSLKVGGVLIAGLDIKQTMHSKGLQQGEWDAILFHRKFGIIVFEIKAAEVEENLNKDKAIKQLDKMIKNVKEIWQSMIGNKKCSVPIYGAICVPNISLENKKVKSRDHVDMSIEILDKDITNKAEKLKAFFASKQEWSAAHESVFMDFQKFVAFFICCRSSVYISFSANAMQIAKWVQQQQYYQSDREKRKLDPQLIRAVNAGTIILTVEQLEILESKEKCISICGGPGTGKTLIIFLRARDLAKKAIEDENKSSRRRYVIIFVNKPLIAKYNQYWDSENKEIKERMLILELDSGNPKFGSPLFSGDDIFLDESEVNNEKILEEISKRATATGSTTVAFTGLNKPNRADTEILQYYETYLKDYRKFVPLTRILRGTKSIFGIWRNYYDGNYIMGHNITGMAVQYESLDNIQEAAVKILSHIQSLLSSFQDDIDNTLVVKPMDIAVLTANNEDAHVIGKILEKNEIQNKSIEYHIKQNEMAVDCFENAPSYEWPFVFVIYQRKDKEKMLPIAASRALGSLYLNEYDSDSNYSSRKQAEQDKPYLRRVQNALKEMYRQRFRKINPFSLPFTFDIENTWVSLALRGDHLHATEDHAELLKSAFEKEKMLIIEGKPATGKTSLMRRLAYEWAKGEEKLAHYDLVVYVEFREVREKECETIADLAIEYLKKYNKFLSSAILDDIVSMLNDQGRNVLILLDGFDESSREKQCKELKNNYFESSTIQNPFFFNIVLTTRPGYLGQHRGKKGRYTFADVLGFITVHQKEKYIYNHFKSAEIETMENIAAVHQLLQRNDNINKLAETPLFLTFICLVHEKIVEGTVLELYCNIIWWIIDRHQKDFPDRNIPLLFEFLGSSDKDKFEIIQDYYHQFPQLHCLGKMGLHNLNKDIFHESDCNKFNLKEVLQQVGLLRKDKYHDKRFRLAISYSFPHRTIQEFLAALYFFCSEEELDLSSLGAATLNSEFDTSKLTQYQSFLLQVALSEGMIAPEKSNIYFERITDIRIDLTFHAFNTIKGLNNRLLNRLLAQCRKVRRIEIHSGDQNTGQNINPHDFRSNYIQEDSNTFSKNSSSLLLTVNNLLQLDSIIFSNCAFEASSELSLKNCPTLKNITFIRCKFQSGKIEFCVLSAIDRMKLEYCTFEADSQLSIKNCPAMKNMILRFCGIKGGRVLSLGSSIIIDTVEINSCNINLEAWQSCTEEIGNSSVKFLKLSFMENISTEYINQLEKCSNLTIETTINGCTIRSNDHLSFNNLKNLYSLTFWMCTFEAKSQLSFKNCPALSVLEFQICTINFEAWLSITEEIRESSVKRLKFTPDCFKCLEFVQECDKIEEIYVVNRWLYEAKSYENDIAQQLIKLAQSLQSLKRIVFEFTEEEGELKDSDRELIEKAGQRRDPAFKVSIIPYKPGSDGDDYHYSHDGAVVFEEPRYCATNHIRTISSIAGTEEKDNTGIQMNISA